MADQSCSSGSGSCCMIAYCCGGMADLHQRRAVRGLRRGGDSEEGHRPHPEAVATSSTRISHRSVRSSREELFGSYVGAGSVRGGVPARSGGIACRRRSDQPQERESQVGDQGRESGRSDSQWAATQQRQQDQVQARSRIHAGEHAHHQQGQSAVSCVREDHCCEKAAAVKPYVPALYGWLVNRVSTAVAA